MALVTRHVDGAVVALIRCQVCGQIHDDDRLKMVVVGAGYVGWSLGSDGCVAHRGEYIDLLMHWDASLQFVAEEQEYA